ncbi:DUF3168 domain-containing protein [Longimicrobium sp.]|uniref:DUF3168 domain-containing protein n=1 Tax=Longimicrobium sp. TaxID=2029185 RepID=UPI002F91CF3A
MSAWPIQVAVAARWLATPAVVALVGDRIYDGEAPQGEASPYVVIGNSTGVPRNTLGRYGATMTLTAHSWAQSPTRSNAEVLTLARQLTLALRQPLSVDGYGTVHARWEFEETQAEADGWRQAITRWRFIAMEDA